MSSTRISVKNTFLQVNGNDGLDSKIRPVSAPLFMTVDTVETVDELAGDKSDVCSIQTFSSESDFDSMASPKTALHSLAARKISIPAIFNMDFDAESDAFSIQTCSSDSELYSMATMASPMSAMRYSVASPMSATHCPAAFQSPRAPIPAIFNWNDADDEEDVAESESNVTESTTVPSETNENHVENKTAEEDFISAKKSHTTMMIRNIPQKLSKLELVTALESAGFDSEAYDFLHFPFSLATKRNVGYAFVNFRTTESADSFVAAFNGSRQFSASALVVTLAAVQGLLPNLRHLMSRKSGRRATCIENPKFQPTIFDERCKQVNLKSLNEFITKLVAKSS